MGQLFLNGVKCYYNPNINICFFYLNCLLSKHFDIFQRKIKISENINNNSFNIKLDEDTYTINYSLSGKINIVPYLLLNNTKLIEFFNKFDLKSTIMNNSEIILYLFFHTIWTDPYDYLVNLFKINEESIYQSFIFFLNKTTSESNNIENFNPIEILKGFFINCNEIPSKYNSLFLFYLKSKKILPFKLLYKKIT